MLVIGYRVKQKGHAGDRGLKEDLTFVTGSDTMVVVAKFASISFGGF